MPVKIKGVVFVHKYLFLLVFKNISLKLDVFPFLV